MKNLNSAIQFAIENSPFYEQGDALELFPGGLFGPGTPGTFNEYVGDTHANVTAHYPNGQNIDQTIRLENFRRAQ